MNNKLKRELAFICGSTAALALRRSPKWATIFSLGAAGFYLSSLQRRFSFQNRSVYITGGSRGLGLSLAWNVLSRGAQVTLAAREEDELNRARDLLLADFPDARIFLSVCDITDSAQLQTSLDEALDSMGGFDVLINNAGSILVGPFESMKHADFEAQMKLHLFSVVQATQHVTRFYKDLGGGRIVNICSLGGKVAVPHMLPYDASKFALAGFSQGLTAELAPLGIKVTTAYPTVMRTGSPLQAIFKGDHEKEFLWFASLDNMPGLSMSADLAAKKILDGVEEEQSEIILSIPAKLRILGGALFPELMNSLMGLAARLLPKGLSQKRKTGAESAALFEKTGLLKPLHKRLQESAETYNQAPHYDAKDMMGLSTKTIH